MRSVALSAKLPHKVATPPRGLVCFAGAGPGDPALRTERAARRIADADIVLEPSVTATVEDLVALAREGKSVACVVAGDPLESPEVVRMARALVAEGVAIEVVPGIGAGSAAAAFAGMLGPVVRLPIGELGRALARHGPGDTVTVVARAGLPSQRVLSVPAAEVPALARDLGDPFVLVGAGRPDEALRWAERRPLFGKRVLVTRAREQAGSLAELLRDAGGDPVVVPTIEIHPPADPGPLAAALASLRTGAYAWVAFTSANGVDHTFAALEALGADARAFGRSRVAAIGPATARTLGRHGLRPDAVASEYRGEALAETMLAAIGPAPVRVLLARAARARDVLPETLRAAGHGVEIVAAYQTLPPPEEVIEGLRRDLAGRRLDVVTFTSSSTVDNLCDLLGPRAPELLAGVRVASIGPVTTASAEARGLRVDVTAGEYTVPGLVEALVESYG